jgi:nitroreductase
MIDGLEMLSLINKRQSERRYTGQTVEKEKIDRIIEAGRLSPSACNGQPWKFIVVDEPSMKQKVGEAARSDILRMNTFIDQAPVIIVIVREKSNFTSRTGDLFKRRDYSIIDIGIATASIIYQSSAEGLGTCIIGWFDEKKIRGLLSIPVTKKVELVITLGYTDNIHRNKVRKPTREIVSYNKY